MTRDYYWAIFGSTQVDPSLQKLLLVDRPTSGEFIFSDPERYSKKEIYRFTNADLKTVGREMPFDSSFYFVQMMSDSIPFTKAWESTWKVLTKKDHNWYRLRAEVYFEIGTSAESLSMVMEVQHQEKKYGYIAKSIPRDQFKSGAWNTLELDYLSPEIRTEEDVLKAYLWFHGQGKVYVREWVIEQYEPNWK